MYGDYLKLKIYEKKREKGNRRYKTIFKKKNRDEFDTANDENRGIKQKRRDSVYRTAYNLKLLIGANLSELQSSFFLTFTYQHRQTDLSQARKDYKAFIGDLRSVLQKEIRYICVFEFQKRGSLHFHALVWGLPKSICIAERATRFIHSFWNLGYVDVIATDDNFKLASYVSKYLIKNLDNVDTFRKKFYITSKNILRPVIYDDVYISGLYFGECGVDLNQYELLKERKYLSVWCGEIREYDYYKLSTSSC